MAQLYEAMDTALMQSAYFHISGELGPYNENWAAKGFQQFVNRYIHTGTRVVPLPGGELGEANEFIKLWCTGKDTKKIEDLGPPVDFPGLKNSLMNQILWDYENLSPIISSWIVMQWTPHIVNEYLSRGSTEHIDAVINEYGDILEKQNFAELKELIGKQIYNSDFIIDERYISAARNAKVDILTYAVAYGISCQLRGRQYADGLSRVIKGIPYTYHWLRDSLVGIKEIDKTDHNSCIEKDEINWGRILSEQIKYGNLKSDVMLIKDILIELKENIRDKEFKKEFSEALQCEDADKRDKKIEKLTLDTLDSLNIIPVYRDTKLMGQLKGTLNKISKESGNNLVTASFQAVDLLLGSNFIRKYDAKMVRRISINWFWKNFKVPGVKY